MGLDIDGRFLAAAEVVDGKLVRVASAELPDGALVDGEVADRAALGDAVKDFASAAGLPREVRLGVSNQQIVVRMLELPQIDDPSERDAALRFQAAEAIAMPLDEAVLDHQVAGFVSSGEGADRMQVVAVAARRSMIEGYYGAVKDAGLRPEGIDLDVFAIVRMLSGQQVLPAVGADAGPDPVTGDDAATDTALLAPTGEARLASVAEDADDGPLSARVYCHLGGVPSLAVAVGPACWFTRTLSTAIDSPDAAGALADEIRMSIDYYMGQPNALPVTDALLSGEPAGDERLVAELGARLHVPVAAAVPLGGLDASPVPGGDDPRRYTVAAGLAMGAAA